MTEFTDEQARERGHRFLVKTSGLEVPVGRALLTLEQKCDVLKDKLALAYDERDAAEARCKALEQERDELKQQRQQAVLAVDAWASRFTAAESRLAEAVRALRWALGEEGEFAPRGEGTGAFWWRTHLRRLAGSALAAVDGKGE